MSNENSVYKNPIDAINQLLGNEFENLKSYLTERKNIIDEYNSKIKAIENPNSDSINNNIQNLNNELSPNLDLTEDDHIKNTVIVQFLQENEVVKLFKQKIKEVKDTNDLEEMKEALRNNCAPLENIDFDFDDSKNIKSSYNNKIKITNDEIENLCDFMFAIWSNKIHLDENKVQLEVDNFLHHWLFKKICGYDFSLVAVKTDNERNNATTNFFKPNENNNDLFINLNNDNDSQTDISSDENYVNHIHIMPDDSDVVNELYYWKKQDFLSQKNEEEKRKKYLEAYRNKLKAYRNKKNQLNKLINGTNFDKREFNMALYRLISDPEFKNKFSKQVKNINAAAMNPDAIDTWMAILNFVDFPLEGDKHSKGIWDIVGFFDSTEYTNLKYLHDQLLESNRLDFRMYCARHLKKIIDYDIQFKNSSEIKRKVAIGLFIFAMLILGLAVNYGLITSSLGTTILAPVACINIGLLAYNYFKSKIIEKAIKLFGCPERYFAETTHEENFIKKDPMYNLVNSIYSYKQKIKNSITVKIKNTDFEKLKLGSQNNNFSNNIILTKQRSNREFKFDTEMIND